MTKFIVEIIAISGGILVAIICFGIIGGLN
jgi:hypothetical protein